MIGRILLAQTDISLEVIANAVIGVVIIALILTYLIWFLNYHRTARKEQKFIRMELGKVAEEVHLLRQELKEVENVEPSKNS